MSANLPPDLAAAESPDAYIARVFPCTPPCDSWGVCDNCCDATLIRAGAKLERAHLTAQAPEFDEAACAEAQAKWKDPAKLVTWGARWQHSQMAAILVAQNRQAIDWLERMTSAEDECERLKRELADYKERVDELTRGPK